MSVQFIAEVSSNHHQDLKRCLEFIDAAYEIGCDSVKFQLFKIEELFAPEILEKSPNHRNRKKWELPLDFLSPIAEQCHKKNMKFSCTPFYLNAVKELEEFVDFYKIASYELLWDDLLKACAETGKPVIISTGMATMKEIDHAVSVLKKSGCKNPTILHCVSGYPTPIDQCNLRAIQTIRDRTGCTVGWSDHTANPQVINRAIHRWDASFIEFHLDLDGKGGEYESGHCWLPSEINKIIQMSKNSYLADGDGIKQPVQAEIKDRSWRADPKDGLRPLREVRKYWIVEE